MQVSQLTDIRSEAREGSGTIQLSFEQGADIDYIFIEVNEKIDRCTSFLPREIERPKVIKASATDIPAFYIDMTLKKEPQTDGLDELHPVSDQFIELSRFASQVITKRIEQLSEVAMVDVSGGVSSELLVIPDEERLRQAGITIGDVENALRSMDISLGSLTIRDGEYQYNVKFRTVAGGKSDVEEMFLKVKGRLFRLKELARCHGASAQASGYGPLERQGCHNARRSQAGRCPYVGPQAQHEQSHGTVPPRLSQHRVYRHA